MFTYDYLINIYIEYKNYIIILLILIFIICSKMLLFNIKHLKKAKSNINFFGYNLFYSDSREDSRKNGIVYSKLLHSYKYNITGKPDYIYRKIGGSALIPVELKSGEIKDKLLPHKGDLMQLVSYFLIIEEEFNIRPKLGYLVYKDYMFVIKNKRALRVELKYILKQMRDMLSYGEGYGVNTCVGCRYCICRGTVCEMCDY